MQTCPYYLTFLSPTLVRKIITDDEQLLNCQATERLTTEAIARSGRHEAFEGVDENEVNKVDEVEKFDKLNRFDKIDKIKAAISTYVPGWESGQSQRTVAFLMPVQLIH